MTAVLLLELSGCGKRMVPLTLLPVPPADARADQIRLPLDPDSVKRLTNSLRFGLSKNNERDDVAVIENAAAKYKELLAALSEPNHPSLPDLDTPAYKKFFPGPLVKQIVDARDKVTPSDTHAPVAANDGAYWWIFYRDRDDKLTGVMVVKVNALQTLIEKRR